MIDPIHALHEGYRLQEYTVTGCLGFGGFGFTYCRGCGSQRVEQRLVPVGFRVARDL